MFEQVTQWMAEHQGTVALIGTLTYEIVGRMVPTEKRASIFSWTGKLLKGIGEISFIISDVLNKVITDKQKPE